MFLHAREKILQKSNHQEQSIKKQVKIGKFDNDVGTDIWITDNHGGRDLQPVTYPAAAKNPRGIMDSQP